MITVKDYAAQKGVTERAVYKQIKGKRISEKLNGHIQTIDGKMWLDDDAVAILNGSRENSPAAIAQVDKDARIKELEDQIKLMITRENILEREKAELSKELKDAYREKAENAKLIASAEANQILLEERTARLNELKEENDQLYLQNQQLQAENRSFVPAGGFLGLFGAWKKNPVVKAEEDHGTEE